MQVVVRVIKRRGRRRRKEKQYSFEYFCITAGKFNFVRGAGALCNSVAAQTSPGIDWEFCGRRREEETDDFREEAECSAEIAGPPEASVSYSPREYRVPNTQCNC